MQRYGMIIKLKPECYQQYKRDHAQVWPEVLAMISACNIKNYSIYHKDGLLFSYFEHHGENLEQDTKKMADHPKTVEWWSIMKPMQSPLETREKGEWWANMEEVFHHD